MSYRYRISSVQNWSCQYFMSKPVRVRASRNVINLTTTIQLMQLECTYRCKLYLYKKNYGLLLKLTFNFLRSLQLRFTPQYCCIIPMVSKWATVTATGLNVYFLLWFCTLTAFTFWKHIWTHRSNREYVLGCYIYNSFSNILHAKNMLYRSIPLKNMIPLHLLRDCKISPRYLHLKLCNE